MDIIEALKSEEVRLQQKLTAIKQAIGVLNGGAGTAVVPGHTSSHNGTSGKRTMSAALRAKLSRKAKERWAKVRAQQAKGKKN